MGAGYRLPVPPAPAFCLGNVLVTRLGYATFTGEVRLFAHEARHATQYACCGGVLMLPLYGIAAARCRGRCAATSAHATSSSRRASLADGGYTEKIWPCAGGRPGLHRGWRRDQADAEPVEVRASVHACGRRDQATSNRSRFMTLAQAATKSLTNFSFASSLA